MNHKRVLGGLMIVAAAALCGALLLLLGQRVRDVAMTRPGADSLQQEREQTSADSTSATQARTLYNDPEPQISGSLVVLDESGAKHTNETGSIYVGGLGVPGGTISIPVAGGKWSPSLIPQGRPYITKIIVGGKEAILEAGQDPILTAGEGRVLICQWLAPVTLHVVDGYTSQELDGIVLYWVDTLLNDRVEIPTVEHGANLVGERLVSPITLPPLRSSAGSICVFAYRHGYSWGQLALDRTGGGDQFIKLTPGADITGIISGNPTVDMTVRLWRTTEGDRHLITERNLIRGEQSPQTVVFLGLSPGRYDVTIEKGVLNRSTVVAIQSIALASGIDVAVELAVPKTAKDTETLVRVRVNLNQSWNLETFTVELTDLDRPEQDPLRSKSFSSDRLLSEPPSSLVSKPFMARCGSYELAVDRIGFGTDQLLSEAPQVQELVITIPPQVRVGVTVVSKATGELIEHARLSWKFLKDSGFPGGGSHTLHCKSPGRIEFVAPQGPISLSVSAGLFENYLFDLRTVTVVNGTEEYIVELLPAYSVAFALREGDRRVEWSANVGRVEFKYAGGAFKPERFGVDQNGLLTCFLPLAREYTVLLPPIPGYEPIAEFKIDITANLPPQVIQLNRLK